MKFNFWYIAPVSLVLAACEPVPNSSASPDGFSPAPQAVLDIAGPNQDLTAVRINPVDGCYEYRHVGPVETTSLPLRSQQERPICTRAAEPA